MVGLGALAGVYLGGRTTDRLLGRGYLNTRVLIPAWQCSRSPSSSPPASSPPQLFLALPLLTIGAGLLGAANPPMDAARLDIIHPALWGRAEGIRTLLRTLGEAAAPALFGLTSEAIFRRWRPWTAVHLPGLSHHTDRRRGARPDRAAHLSLRRRHRR
ncbi:MAG: hypothetical protein ACJ72I_21010 [Pseudonocardiaceae bacterium]